MAYPIGIDLGTTNSVGCVYRRGVVETIPVDGRSAMPSVISVLPNGTILIGNEAKRRAMIEPSSSITSVKRHIGDGKTKWEIQGKVYTPRDVSALIIKRIKEAAEAFLKGPVSEAVITVPAYFNNNQKRETKLAGEDAGLRVLHLLTEPTAAAVSYGLGQGKEQTLLVYDLGGGTFDVSVLRVKGDSFEEVAVDGDFNLGGDDFDLLLTDHFIGLLQKKTKADLGLFRSLLRRKKSTQEDTKEMLLARQQLKEAAEKAKIELSESDTALVELPEILETRLDEEITISTYNSMIEPLVTRTTGLIGKVLKSAGLSAMDIDRVILVGGSTRNRLVKERVAKEVKEPYTSDRVDEVVAQGAAIVAGHMSSPETDLTPIPLFSVTPFSLGVRASKGDELDFFEVLVPKNTRVDKADVTREFSTLRANQKTVDVHVFQGESTRCKENTFIGGFQLSGIPPAPAGQPKILVRFKMDSSDLLSVNANCSNLASEKTLDVNMVSREEELPETKVLADILFLIDTSGSMSAELDGVKTSGLDFANRVIEAGIDCRLGLMDFDLPCASRNYRWEAFGPMEPRKFPSAISGLRIGRLGGCGCYVGEKNTIPVVVAFAKAFPTEERMKIGILISDEVGNDSEAVKRIVQIVKGAGITLHVLGVARSCHEVLSRETGGKFWDIQASRGRVDFSELLDSVAAEITNLAVA